MAGESTAAEVLRKYAWLICVVALITAAVTVAIARYALPSKSPPASAPSAIQFGTLPPGAKLPSGAQCARWVLASPNPENRRDNTAFNHTTGQNVGPQFFPAGDSPQVGALASRINGDFTGTTEEILRWAACKWGIDQNVVFAQAAAESWWQQNELGDWQTQALHCAPGRGLGVDGRPGSCPESFGILENKYIFEKNAWPAIANSTAMGVDAAYAIWRSCYDGYEVWLNDVARGKQYSGGDMWGCVGRWSAGAWYTPAANTYIALVKKYLDERIWEQPAFREARLPSGLPLA
jgi:autotransporter family porin